MASTGIRVTLEVKGTSNLAQEEVKRRLTDVLNKWYVEGPMEPPYPEGSLLHWTINVSSLTGQ